MMVSELSTPCSAPLRSSASSFLDSGRPLASVRLSTPTSRMFWSMLAGLPLPPSRPVMTSLVVSPPLRSR